jgi:hypothetical protein
MGLGLKISRIEVNHIWGLRLRISESEVEDI